LNVAHRGVSKAISRSRDKLDVFCAGLDGHIYTAAWEPAFGAQWHGWWRIGDGQTTPGAPIGAVSRSADKLDVFCAGLDGRIYTAAWEPAFGAQWHGWWRIGDLRAAPGSQVIAVSRAADKIDVFCTGEDGHVYTAAWESNRGGWRGWWRVGDLQIF
jgi:hypothetical protein